MYVCIQLSTTMKLYLQFSKIFSVCKLYLFLTSAHIFYALLIWGAVFSTIKIFKTYDIQHFAVSNLCDFMSKVKYAYAMLFMFIHALKSLKKIFLFISAQFFDAFTANKRFFGGGGGKGGGGGGLGGLFGGGGAGGASGYGAPQKPSYGAPTNKPSYGAPTNKPSYGGGGTGFKNIQLPVPGQFNYYISISTY